MNLNYSLLLGSKSPRRLQLLQEAGFDPEVVEIISKEVFPQLLPVMEVAKFLAEQKAEAYTGNLENKILITADTIVTIDDRMLGKPKDDPPAASHENWEGSTKSRGNNCGRCRPPSPPPRASLPQTRLFPECSSPTSLHRRLTLEPVPTAGLVRMIAGLSPLSPEFR